MRLRQLGEKLPISLPTFENTWKICEDTEVLILCNFPINAQLKTKMLLISNRFWSSFLQRLFRLLLLGLLVLPVLPVRQAREE